MPYQSDHLKFGMLSHITNVIACQISCQLVHDYEVLSNEIPDFAILYGHDIWPSEQKKLYHAML